MPAFETSLFDSPTMGITTDIIEVGIDSILDEGLFRDVPIFGVNINCSTSVEQFLYRLLS